MDSLLSFIASTDWYVAGFLFILIVLMAGAIAMLIVMMVMPGLKE
jgi:hypothetical protein